MEYQCFACGNGRLGPRVCVSLKARTWGWSFTADVINHVPNHKKKQVGFISAVIGNWDQEMHREATDEWGAGATAGACTKKQSHGRLVFFFLWQKRKQGSWQAKQAQIGGREVQLRTTRPVQPFGSTAAGRNMTMYVVK